MVLFGVPPTRPETGYGYIRGSQDANTGLPDGIKRVAQFVESRTKRAPRAIWSRATITGTAACSCSAPVSSWMN